MMAGVGVVILTGLLQAFGMSGTLPADAGPIESPARVLWLPADQSPDDRSHECVMTAATRWSCPSVPLRDSGILVILGNGAIGYVVLGPSGPIASGRAEWGRLVRIASPNVDRLNDLRLSSWTVDRPPSRPNTQKLDVIPDVTFAVVRISATSFWVSGPIPSPDAFLRLDGPGIARHDTTMQALAGGPLDSPFVVDATSGLVIVGRVETRSGEPVDGALIELFARPPGANEGPVDQKGLVKLPVVRLATVNADSEGRFEFGGLENGSYQVVATAFSRGRLARWTTTASPPLLMTLEPPATATGRVVRQKLPAPDVKVRFVPARAAWRDSTDPAAHLTADVSTDEAGRFTLPLPPQPSGDVQFIAPDGASMRIGLPVLSNLSEITLGDVALPELIAVVLRADVDGCRLTAIGPAGALGLAVVPARASASTYQFDLPEPGEWFLDAECSDRHVSVQPPSIQVKSTRSPAPFDVHVVDRR